MGEGSAKIKVKDDQIAYYRANLLFFCEVKKEKEDQANRHSDQSHMDR